MRLAAHSLRSSVGCIYVLRECSDNRQWLADGECYTVRLLITIGKDLVRAMVNASLMQSG